MPSISNPTAERRIIFRRASDFSDSTRYSGRTAEANAQVQSDTHEKALLSNLESDVKKANLSGTPSSSLLKTEGATNLRQAAGETDAGAASTLQQAQNAGQFQTYNTETGQSKTYDLGEIDRSAVDRLMGTGMSEGEAIRQVQGNRENVQDAFNQAGTGQSPTQIRSQQRGVARSSADAAEADVRRKYADLGIADPIVISKAVQEARAGAINEETANIQKQNAEIERDKIKSQGATDPVSAGIGAAFANLPPEAQFLAPFLQQMQQSFQQSMQENAQFAQQGMESIQQTYGGIQDQLNTFAETNRSISAAIQETLKDTKEQNDKALAEQEKSEKERLGWAELEQRRALSKQKREAHEAMVAQIALAGGFGQDAGIAAVMESDAEFEGRISDLAVQFGYARNDLAAKYSALYAENNNTYATETVKNMRELQSSLERLGMQSISNAQSKQQAEQSLLQNAMSTQIGLRNTLASQNMDAAWKIRGEIRQDKQDKIDAEDRALKQIGDLLDQFPEQEVRGLIMELGKNVKSFSVEQMLNAKSKDEIKAAQAAAAARQNALNMELLKKQRNAPLVTKDEFLQQKIAEKEQELGMSMSQKAREEYLKANSDYFDATYDQYSSPDFENITSGDPNIDAAADAFMRGDLPSIKEAAKTYGVSAADVTNYVGLIKSDGANTGDVRALDKLQRDQLTALTKELKNNEVTKKRDLMKLAIPKIDIAADASSGIGDVALLNFYQNGIVDPGLAVRKEDQELLSKASALADKAKLSFVKDRFIYSKTFTEESRAEMARIANAVYEATNRIYEDEVLQPVIEDASLSGIKPVYFNRFVPQKSTSGNNADDYVNSFLP